jgi:flagellar basal-body rod protein FlgF
MNEVLAIALHSMHYDMASVDHVAINMSNMTTPGYRSEFVSVRPFASYLNGTGVTVDDINSVQNDTQDKLSVKTDTHLGTLKLTGQNLDLALATEGYFEVTTDNGPAYTRQGNFHVDSRGRLATADGNPVIGKGGEIYLGTSQPTIDSSGNVLENGKIVGQIKVVQFDNPKNMKKMGNGIVAAGTGMTVLSDTETQIRQGYLENSNVNSMREMMQMMKTMRHFETMQKIAQGYDSMLGTAFQKLGDM